MKVRNCFVTVNMRSYFSPENYTKADRQAEKANAEAPPWNGQ